MSERDNVPVCEGDTEEATTSGGETTSEGERGLTLVVPLSPSDTRLCLSLSLVDLFCGILLIFAPQSDGQTDPLEAPPWTPGVLAHLVPSRGAHPAQKLESYCCNMARTAKRTDVVTPPGYPRRPRADVRDSTAHHPRP